MRQTETMSARDARQAPPACEFRAAGQGGLGRCRSAPRLAGACGLLAATLIAPVAAPGQAHETSRDRTARMSPSPARLAVWTDESGYATRRHTIRAYLAMRRQEDRAEYSRVVHLEHVLSGERQYWQGLEPGSTLGDEPPRWSMKPSPVPDLGDMKF